MSADKEKSQRRVYVLPSELVERIVGFQTTMGLQSEVEAVRRLLDEALMVRDDWRSIALRFKDKMKETKMLTDIAKEVLVGHPLVSTVHFGSTYVRFMLSTGESVEVNSEGTVTATDVYDKKLDFEVSPSKLKRSVQQTKHSDITF